MTSLAPNQPPYADPIIVLSSRSIRSSTNTVRNQNLPKTRLHHICERFIKFLNYLPHSFLIIAMLAFAMYQIVLAGYNCPLPDTNLGWIRASLFMNIPFVLGVLCYVVVLLIQKQPPTYDDIQSMAYSYLYIFLYHLYIDCLCILSGMEMDEVRKALNNATLVASLPCSESYYRQVFGMMIMQYLSPVLCLIIFVCLLSCKSTTSSGFTDKLMNRCDGIIYGIVNKWRSCKAVIFRRHTEEILIENL